MTTARLAAYGLAFTGLGGSDLLPTAPPDVPVVALQFVATGLQAPEQDVRDGDVYRRSLTTGHALIARRHPATATVTGPPLPVDERVHPYLAPIASVHNRWRGRVCVHGGVFELDGRAWVVVGAREVGKSSLLAALAARGVRVLADDLAVLEAQPDPVVFSGPACIDLRSPLPHRSLELTGVRQNTRSRLALPHPPFVRPLAGWVLPRWAGDVSLVRMPVARLLPMLARSQRTTLREPPDPSHLLELSARPAWVWDRPRAWSRSEESVDALLATLDRSLGAPRHPDRASAVAPF